MQKLLLSLVLFIWAATAVGQTKAHKLVYDLSSADTADQGVVLRQFNNVLRADPEAQLEVVCHGQAIYMMVADKTVFESRMKDLKNTGKVAFKVCANSMKRYNVDKSALISLADVVPVAVLELSDRQADGWSYIKAGH